MACDRKAGGTTRRDAASTGEWAHVRLRARHDARRRPITDASDLVPVDVPPPTAPFPLDHPHYHIRPEVGEARHRVFIGPANFAGQGFAWARALEREVPSTRAVAFCLTLDGGFEFPSDYEVPAVPYRKNRRWQREQFAYVRENFTHAVIEAGRPLFADLTRLDVFYEADLLDQAGVVTTMLAHGTDIRDVDGHAARFSWSPYHEVPSASLEIMRTNSASYRAGLRRFRGTTLVSTPDLLDDAPYARWCPVTVDPDRWRPEPSRRSEHVVVAHVPSNGVVKGSQAADAAMEGLSTERGVEYRRLEGVLSQEMPSVLQSADIYLDQFRLGSYGVAAVEAMASGCTVVGNVTSRVRERVRRSTGLELPIVQAEPHEIRDVVASLVASPEDRAEISQRSRAFAKHVHDGRASATALTSALQIAKTEARVP